VLIYDCITQYEYVFLYVDGVMFIGKEPQKLINSNSMIMVSNRKVWVQPNTMGSSLVSALCWTNGWRDPLVKTEMRNFEVH
jgi:hypothetical protein